MNEPTEKIVNSNGTVLLSGELKCTLWRVFLSMYSEDLKDGPNLSEDVLQKETEFLRKVTGTNIKTIMPKADFVFANEAELTYILLTYL